ncbi:MAG TPA: hypothetical protein VFZ34_07880 [Blastocatellia bacterium]|nr:hypothetical protein [Blastocatellia bacterium]
MRHVVGILFSILWLAVGIGAILSFYALSRQMPRWQRWLANLFLLVYALMMLAMILKGVIRSINT